MLAQEHHSLRQIAPIRWHGTEKRT